MNAGPRVLVVDDEVQMRRLLQLALGAAGYDVVCAETGAEGIRQASAVRPDVVMLDLGLGDMEGMEVLRTIRGWSRVPVLIVSVRSAERDIIAALDAGADDYLSKPFRTGELLARLRAACRRSQAAAGESIFRAGALTVDLARRVVRKRGAAVKLTPIEYALLALFIRNAGRVLTHRYILEQVWGPSFVEETQYTRVYVGQLRKKLEEDPDHPRLFETASGIGYRCVLEEEPPPPSAPSAGSRS
ncbi:MAG: response regulator [Bacteroidota bacterium]